MAATLTTQSTNSTPEGRALRSTVAYKALMAVTGLFLVAFLLMHMFGNLKLLTPDNGAEFDAYSRSLRTLLYPILPNGFFLWTFRVVLSLSVIVHLVAAVHLTLRDYRARGGGGRARYIRRRYLEGSFAARTMIWSGVIIVTFLIFHVLQFTDQVIKIGYAAGDPAGTQPHLRVVLAFQNPWILLLYAVSMAAVCLHVWHGFYSAFCTLGARVGATTQTLFRVLAWIVAVLLFVGFMLAPVLIATGVIFK
jgi:succinate dehydrogenase / fumarate reductase cytochrome b subunit